MGSKSSFFVMIIAIAVLALTSAALASYLFIVQGTPAKSNDNTSIAEKAEIPKEEDLVKIPLYDGKRVFNLKTNGSDKNSMIQVNVTLKCFKTLKENKKVVVAEKVAAHSEEIQELIVRFFLTKTIDDVKNVEFMDNAKETLTKQINDLLNEGIEHPETIVYKVIFSEWIFQ